MSLVPPSPSTFPALAPYGLVPSAPACEDAQASAYADEDRLWRLWREQGDATAREELAQRYVPYARALAAKCYSRRVHNEFEFEEYFHFAMVGMMEALERYEPGRGALFKTFATPRINGAILNGLDGLSERQQQIGLQQRLARERIASLRSQEAAAGDSGQQLLQELGEIGVGVALGFLLEGTGMLIGGEDALPDNAYSHIEVRQLQERLWQLVDQLTEREAQVIRRHYLQQQAFEDIAVSLQLTRGRISQLHRQALERIRRLLAAANFDVVW